MTWKRICSANDVAANSTRKFEVGGIPVLVVNYGAGYRVIPPICPHMEEQLAESGIVARNTLTCSKHLWSWNLDTLEMRGDTERPLKTYDVKEEDGAILANIQGELTYEFEADGGDDDDDFFA